MFFEYAVDPAVLSNWERVRYFLDAFGPWKGRFLAQYPRRWKKLVYDGLDTAGCRPVEKSRIEVRLRNLDRRIFSPRSNAAYDPNRSWLENAVAEHERAAFRAVIAKSEVSGLEHVLDASAVDDTVERWRTDQGALLLRDPALIVKSITLLLDASSHVLVIDPYFRADQGDKLVALREICAVVADRNVPVEVHFADEARGYAPCVADATRVLPDALPSNAKVTMHCWREQAGGPRLHNRFILTDVGGVQFGDGIERGERGHDDRISILEESTRARLWDQYAGARPAFEPAGAPCQFRGR